VESYGIAYGMGLTAEKVAQAWKVSREAQDEFAYRSHMKAIAAMKAGEFANEITPVEVAERSVDLGSAECQRQNPHRQHRRRRPAGHHRRRPGQAAYRVFAHVDRSRRATAVKPLTAPAR
jgi:hypothetical protein